VLFCCGLTQPQQIGRNLLPGVKTRSPASIFGLRGSGRHQLSNNPQTSATNAVTLAIGANPSNGTLSGTTTVNAVNGVATFSGLNISKTGTGYLLSLIVAHSRIPCRRAPSPGSTSSHFPSNSDTAVRAVTKVTAGAIATG
jgi:hypothetical protein